MPNVIQVQSARGGAGATTCAFYLGCALSECGERTLIVDGDADCADGLTVSGMNGLNVYTLADAEKGACRVKQAVLQHGKQLNLFILPTLGCNNGEFITQAATESAALFDYVLCDNAAAGACDKAVVITEPYLSSIKSADKKIARLKDGGIRNIGVIVNKVNGGLVFDGEIMTPQEIASVLRCELWGVIPEDLTLPIGKINRTTLKSFALTADKIRGKSEKIYGVIKPYAGLGGTIKRRLRKLV